MAYLCSVIIEVRRDVLNQLARALRIHNLENDVALAPGELFDHVLGRTPNGRSDPWMRSAKSNTRMASERVMISFIANLS